MRIFYKGLCFPFEAYSMSVLGDNVCFDNVYKNGKVRVIECRTNYTAKRLAEYIRNAYMENDKLCSVDAWFGRS